ncbi:MAG: Gldg family protein [Verrucomicrobiota bacterium]
MKSKPLETLLYSAVGVAAMAIIVIAGNIVTSAFKQRIDLTKEQAYTLSPGTRAILKKLDTTVKVRLYVTQGDASSPETVFLRGYARKIEDLLAEYRQAANGKLVVEKLDPQPDSDAEDSARLDGVEGEMLQNGEKFYLGLSVSIIDSKQAIPFLAPNRERQLEYDLSRAITRVVSPDKPVVGIMSPMPVFGAPSNPMMARMGQQGSQPWALVTELKNDFSVKSVPMDSEKIDDDVKVLIVIHPRDIQDKAQYAIDQFVLRGGKLIAYLDPLPLIDSKEQNQMFGSIPNSGSNLEKLMKSWGFALDTSKVVADLNYKMQLGGRNGQPQEAPAFLSVTADGINGDDIVTSQIDNIWLPFAGAITGTPVAGLTMTPLIKSTKQSQLVDGFMANLSGENVIKEFKPSLTEYILGMRLKGKFKTAFPGGKPGETNAPAGLKESAQENNVIVFADADMLFDNFAMRQVQSPFGNMAMAMNGNLNMAQNAVEQLAGDNNLIGVRSRAVQNRPFTVVKKMQAEAESNYRSKIKDMEESLAETQRQLSELQQKKEKGQRFILSPEQQAALETFRKKESDVKIKLKEERKQLRHDIDALETRLKWFNIAAMPLLVSLSGIGLAMFKRKKTAAR